MTIAESKTKTGYAQVYFSFFDTWKKAPYDMLLTSYAPVPKHVFDHTEIDKTRVLKAFRRYFWSVSAADRGRFATAENYMTMTTPEYGPLHGLLLPSMVMSDVAADVSRVADTTAGLH